MFLIRETVERKLANVMGYEYCTLFDSGRSALKALRRLGFDIPIPSNVCRTLHEVLPEAAIIPVSRFSGLAPIPVQLYGYRVVPIKCNVEIDPLMTGFMREPFARNKVISFGRKKMLDIGSGGALLSNERYKGESYFPEGLRTALDYWLPQRETINDIARNRFRDYISSRWKIVDEWDRHLGDSCTRIPREQIMPWRVIRRIPDKIRYGISSRDAVVKALREAGHAVGTNYPPLPGVTDEGAIQWGREVVNFFLEEPNIPHACDIIKRTVE